MRARGEVEIGNALIVRVGEPVDYSGFIVVVFVVVSDIEGCKESLKS